MSNFNEKFMIEALKQADIASSKNEVPIGCVIVKNNQIIARSYNQREMHQDPLGHAETLCIKKASKKLHDWQLIDCDLYVTLEPCLMCAGAIIQSRIQNVYFGAFDPKGGAFGSSINVLKANNLNHIPNVVGGILEEECSTKIKKFFKNKRK